MTILTLLNLAFVLFATHTGAFQKRIVGGEAASSGYVRHLAYILVRTNNGSYFPCTGTVVGRRWILSAAHCVEDEDVGGSADPRGTKVYIGSSSAFPMLSQSPLRVTRLLVHNSWKAGSFDMRHDIALLHLRDRIPDESYETVKFSSAPEAGTRVVAVGYGAMNEDGQNPKRAMQTTLIAQNFETCASREQGEVREYLRDALQVCATSVGFPKRGVTDTCCKYTHATFLPPSS